MNRCSPLLPATLAACSMFLLSACAGPQRTAAPVKAADVGELRAGTGILKGYLPSAELPDSLALLPAPPAAGSAALAEDTATFKALTALQSGPRGKLAVVDADLSYPQSISTFSCALGIPVSENETPNLTMLLRRTLADAGLATYKAKDKYQRTRPFVALKAHSCTPAEEAKLAKDGSYPSGHASLGWAWALVLSEVAPERADVLLQRGRAFGQSRAICGAHWQSDVDAGRLVGAATVAKMHSSPVFMAQLEAARAEWTATRARGAKPAGDCAAEAAALATSSGIAP
jgi:acid phosphatase (class A)